MVLVGKVMLVFGLATSAAAQSCQNYWRGTAPFCNPDSNCGPGYQYTGIRDVRGDGARCITGKKKLCQCIAPGSGPGCIPTLPPHEYHSKWVTICDNGCNVYICGVWFFHFWKRDVEVGMPRRGLDGVLGRRRLPCEDAPEQPHCQLPDPVDPTPSPSPTPTPPSIISAKPLTHEDVLNAYKQADYSVLAEKLYSEGVNVTDKTQDELVQSAYSKFEASMVVLNIEHVDAKASFDGFEKGQEGWAYVPGTDIPKDQA